ncbi:MAG: hypothetical protein JXQ73_18385 [Phycisphaerae bacterium]|nr:hypothetical protein [Phycisphaerae bacterium]
MATTRRWCFPLLSCLLVAGLLGCGNEKVGSLLGGALTTMGLGGSGGLTVIAPDFPVRVGEQRQLRAIATGQASVNDIVEWQISGAGGTLTSAGLFTATSIGQCTVWATYLITPTDANLPSYTATTNRVTFDVWPNGPSV